VSRRQFKPGDLLADEVGSAFFVVEVTGNSRAAWGEGVHAIDADGNGWRVDSVEDARRLVVIDPEDREQLKRLLTAIYNQPDPLSPTLHGLADALREFANPKPPVIEPQGLGAVVEDAEGKRWVRAARIAHGWHRPMGTWAEWADWSGVDAVRVLSEGVTA